MESAALPSSHLELDTPKHETAPSPKAQDTKGKELAEVMQAHTQEKGAEATMVALAGITEPVAKVAEHAPEKPAEDIVADEKAVVIPERIKYTPEQAQSSEDELSAFQEQLQTLTEQFAHERELTEAVRDQSWALTALDTYSQAVHTLTESRMGNAASVASLMSLTALSQITEVPGVAEYFQHVASADTLGVVAEVAEHAATVAGGLLAAEGPIAHLAQKATTFQTDKLIDAGLAYGGFSNEQLLEIFQTKGYDSAISAEDMYAVSQGEQLEDTTNPFVSLYMKANEASAAMGRMGEGVPLQGRELQADRQQRAKQFLETAIQVQRNRREPATVQSEVIGRVGRNVATVAGLHMLGPALGLVDDVIPFFRPLSRGFGALSKIASGISGGGTG